MFTKCLHIWKDFVYVRINLCVSLLSHFTKKPWMFYELLGPVWQLQMKLSLQILNSPYVLWVCYAPLFGFVVCQFVVVKFSQEDFWNLALDQVLVLNDAVQEELNELSSLCQSFFIFRLNRPQISQWRHIWAWMRFEQGVSVPLKIRIGSLYCFLSKVSFDLKP